MYKKFTVGVHDNYGCGQNGTDFKFDVKQCKG